MIKTPEQILTNINYLLYESTSSYKRYIFTIKKKIPNLPKGVWVLNLYRSEFDKNYLQKLLKLSALGFIPEIYLYGENYIISKYLTKYKSLSQLQNDKYYEYTENKNLIYENLMKIVNRWHIFGYAHNNISSGNILLNKEFEIILINPKKSNNLTEDLSQIRKLDL